MKKIIFQVLFQLVVILHLGAQTCISEEYREEILGEFPERRESIELIERALQAYLKNENNFQRTAIAIPVVVHILWREDKQNIPDKQIYAQIDALNRDYRLENENAHNIPSVFKELAADTEIEFCLAQRTPEGAPTTGITRNKTDVENLGITQTLYSSLEGGKDAWDTEHYLNIWVCEMPREFLGYGTYPGISGHKKDGVVINYRYFGMYEESKPYNLGRTLTHEIGHYFNLEHSFGSVFGVCENTDYVDDTPLQKDAYYHCPEFPQESCGSIDMTMNFMQLVDDRCMSMFTLGQKERMLATLATARQGLLNHSFCGEIYDHNQSDKIIIFPNPTENILNFKITSEKNEPVVVQLVNSIGQICFQSEYLSNEFYYLNLKNILSSGVYFFRVIFPSGKRSNLNEKIIFRE